MKLSNLFYVGALSALALTSCKSNDDNSEWLGSDGVNFTSYIEGLTSRASGSAWDDGDRVGIFMTAGADEFANREYTASAAGNLTPAGQALKWPEEGSASFMAYYPYTASLNGKTYTVNVTDQADPKKIDLLYSNNAADIANGETVNLAFKHQLSQIVINVEKDATIESTNGLAIAISGMDTQASFDLNDGTLTPGGNKGNIAMNVNAEGTQAEAIVIPAADLSGAKMTFTLQGMSFDYDVTGTYEAGTKYTYKATLSVLNGQPTVTMGTATIEDWKDQAGGDINVDFEEGEAPSGEEFVALNESFATGQGAFTIEDKELGELDYVWTFDSQYGMKASAYNGKQVAAESWLISPEIDLTKATTVNFSFDHAINQTKGVEPTVNHIVAVSKDNGNSWTPLSGFTYPAGTNWTFVSSGNIDLSAYAGQKIKIAFQYKSTDTSAATWEIKNVKVVGNPGGGSGTVDPDPEPEPTPGEGAYTSNITLPENSPSAVQTNAYGQLAEINGTQYPVLKLGTSSKAGLWTSDPINAGATKLSLYAVAWNKKTCQLTISINNGGTFEDSQTSKTIDLAANSGAAGNPEPAYQITPASSDYYTFTLKDITSSSTITFSTGEDSGNARAILFGINVK